jgi:hypothetical protein
MDPLPDTLQACRVVEALHQIYDKEAKADNPRFENGYHGHYAHCFFGGQRTDPGVLVVKSYYGIPVSKIITPMGTLACFGSGYTKVHNSQEEAVYNQDLFDMVLIKEGYQTRFGYYGPWYQITRIGDVTYPLVTWDESIFHDISYDEQKENFKKLAEHAFRQRIHTDRLGLTDHLLYRPHNPPNPQDFLTNNLNKHIYIDFCTGYIKDFNDALEKGTIRWDLWWTIMYYTHNNSPPK